MRVYDLAICGFGVWASGFRSSSQGILHMLGPFFRGLYRSRWSNIHTHQDLWLGFGLLKMRKCFLAQSLENFLRCPALEGVTFHRNCKA